MADRKIPKRALPEGLRLDTLAVREGLPASPWGENSEANYQDYLDFLLKNGVLKQQAKAADLITNELIDDMNKFDQAEVINLAKTYKAP